MTDRAAADNQQSNAQRPAPANELAPQVDPAVAAGTRALVVPGSVSDVPGSVRRRPGSILSLQRSVGNAAVARLLRETEHEIRRDEDDEVDEETVSEPEPVADEEASASSDPEPTESAPDDPVPVEESTITDEPIIEDEGTEEASADGEVVEDEGTEEASADGEVVEDEGTEEASADGETIEDEGTEEDGADGEVVDDEGTDESTDAEGGETVDDEGTESEEEDDSGPSLSLPFSLDSLIVDDDDEVEEGQLTRSAFLSQVRAAVVPQATAIMSEAGSEIDIAGGIDFWSDKISALSGPNLQRAINVFAPGTRDAETAAQMVPIVASKILGPVRVYATTGEISAVPDIPGIGTPLFDPGVLFKAAGDATPSAADPLAIRAKLGPGEPMTGSTETAMASALGYQFDDVRIHRDSVASTLAAGFDARAFTVGSHIAFAQGEHQPGTLVGDALMAHELAHVAQQKQGAASGVQTRGAGDENALEADADRVAVNVVSALRGGRAGLGEWAKTLGPSLRSGLRLQRCKSKGEEPKASVPTNDEVTKQAAILDGLIARPVENADALQAKLAELGPYAGHILLKVNMLADRRMMTIAAGTAKGTVVLTALIDALNNGDYAAFAPQLRPNGEDPNSILARDEGRMRALSLKAILDQQSADAPASDKDTAAEITRVNAIINGDSRSAEYRSTGVKLPITLFNPGSEKDGGIYYDPHLGEEGVTEAVQIDKQRAPNPDVITIRIGRKALIDTNGTPHTDAFVRSAMNHEFQHFKQYLDFRKKALDNDPRVQDLKVDEVAKETSRAANAEVEAIAAQLANDIADMSNDGEVRSILGYLATKWNWASDDTRSRAIAQMKDTGRPLAANGGVQMKRLLKLITAMGLQKAAKPVPGPGGTKETRGEDLSSLVKALK